MQQKMRDQLEDLLGQSEGYYKNKIGESYGNFDLVRVTQVILFGAAEMGKIYIDLFRENHIAILSVCDNDASKNGLLLNDVKVISVSELKEYPKDIPIVITTIYDEEVYRQLTDLGFTNVFPHFYFSINFPDKFYNPHWISSIDEILNQKEDILKCFDLLVDDLSKDSFLNIISYRLLLDRSYIKKIERPKNEEYFDTQIVPLSSEEIFIDGGAYTGDTIEHFMRVTKGEFKEVHSFEPDSISFAKLQEYTRSLGDSRIHVYPFGLGESKKVIKFSNQGTLGSKAVETAGGTAEIVDLDSILFDKNPTLIKLDIEGYELDALNGAQKIITKKNPRMAVCIYHKPADLWQLPLLLKEMTPKYKIFIRHYSPFLYDTVCYAVI